MNLIDLTQYSTNEEKAEEYLHEQGILKAFKECPYCQGTWINQVRRFKYKCYSCNHEWRVRRDSILEGLRVPFTNFLIAIKLFEINTSVREALKQLGLAHNTVYNLHFLIRKAILAMQILPHSLMRLKWMNHILVEGERENVAVAPQERFPLKWSPMSRGKPFSSCLSGK